MTDATRLDHTGPQASHGSDHDVLLRARGLTKRFGDFVAVDGIDVEVHRGEAFGFLGPNGAGKIVDDADDRLRLPGHRG